MPFEHVWKAKCFDVLGQGEGGQEPRGGFGPGNMQCSSPSSAEQALGSHVYSVRFCATSRSGGEPRHPLDDETLTRGRGYGALTRGTICSPRKVLDAVQVCKCVCMCVCAC